MLYGRLADEVLRLDGHWASGLAKCKVLWTQPGSEFAGIGTFLADREPGQVAVGLQSFIGLPLEDIRAALGNLPD